MLTDFHEKVYTFNEPGTSLEEGKLACAIVVELETQKVCLSM